MSGPLRLYRTTVNLRGLGNGTEIEIDPTDEGWAADIRTQRLIPVEPASGGYVDLGTVTIGEDTLRWISDVRGEEFVAPDPTPSFDGVAFGDLPTDDEVGRALSGADE